MSQQILVTLGKRTLVMYDLKELVFLAGAQKGLSKTKVKKLIEQGAVKVEFLKDMKRYESHTK
jgi:hypothetical protein